MDQLPNEILIKILRNLGIYDLLQFCTTFSNFDYFLKEKDVISYQDWSKRFETQSLNLCKIISTKMNVNCIKVLNINSIYWIPEEDLRKLIGKLPVLEELYAIDTKLAFKPENASVYGKMKKIAISINDDHDLEFKSSKFLFKYAYFKIICRTHQQFSLRLTEVVGRMEHLTELWIQDESESNLNYERLILQLGNLQKLVIKSNSVLPMYDFRYKGLSKTFDCKRFNTETEVIFEKVLDRKPAVNKSIFEPKENDLEKAWDVFENLHAFLPCGYKEQKLLYLREDVKNIEFNDLNFCHIVILCNSKYVEAARQILNSKNCNRLKKLSFRSCLFQDFQQTLKENAANKLFKKPRIGIQKEFPNHPFDKTAKNLKNLVELEVYSCPGCNSSAVVSAYRLIANFENLQRLSLEVSLLLDGAFLEEVLQKCLRLESLFLTLTVENMKFLQNLYKYLHYTNSLKDFRLECFSVNLEKLFSTLCQIPSRKLLRIFIKSDNIDYISTANALAPFSSFFEDNQQLVFFFLATSKATVKQISNIQRIIYDFQKGNRAKLYYCKKNTDSVKGSFPISSAHHDIIFNRTRVSVIDFDTF